MSGIIFDVKDLEEVLKVAAPRTYTTKRLVDGKYKQTYIVPVNPSLQIVPKDDHLHIVSLVYRFDNQRLTNTKMHSAFGILVKRVKAFLGEHYPDHDITIERNLINNAIPELQMIYRLGYCKKAQQVNTTDLTAMFDSFKGVVDFCKVQQF